jgi:hypothetical protein
MSTVKHQFVISSQELARWLDSQPGTWWFVGRDDLLISKVNFPCPSGELAEALRGIGHNLVISTDKAIGIEDGRQIDSTVLPLLADTENRYRNRDFLARWQGSDKDWLLTEDKWAAKALADDATEGYDGEVQDGSEPED